MRIVNSTGGVAVVGLVGADVRVLTMRRLLLTAFCPPRYSAALTRISLKVF